MFTVVFHHDINSESAIFDKYVKYSLHIGELKKTIDVVTKIPIFKHTLTKNMYCRSQLVTFSELYNNIFIWTMSHSIFQVTVCEKYV